MDQKVVQSKKVLSEIQSLMVEALDSYQEGRDLPAIKKFFPKIDQATSSIAEVLKTWPDCKSLPDPDCKDFGVFLGHFVEDLFKKIESKV